MIKKIVATILCLALAVLAYPALEAIENKNTTFSQLSLIVDTDMGIDDVMALLSLLQKPNIEIQAITVTGTGLAHDKEGLRNLRELLNFFHKGDIPIAVGREAPLQGGRCFPDYMRKKSDTLLDHRFPPREDWFVPSSPNAVELLRATLEASPEKITILALGPLTNLAELFQKDPKLVEKVEKLHIMGGAVDVPGNLHEIQGNDSAEWNIYADPLAAKEVFQLGIPIDLIALDATNQVPLTQEFYDFVEKNHQTSAADIFYEILQTIKIGRFCFWDLLAVETLIDPSLVQYENRTVDIITSEGLFYGRTAPCDTGYPIRLAKTVDAQRFMQVYWDSINSL